MFRFALFLLSFGIAAAAGAAPRRPNFLFLFADDLSYNAIRAAGNPDVRTPNIDRLAARGARFINAYNAGSWTPAVCVASRAMLNRGLALSRARREIPAGRYWSRRMAAAGWETYFAGKWHVGTPPRKVFDHVGTVRGGMPPTVGRAYNRGDIDDDVWCPFDTSVPGHWSGGTHWAEVLAGEAAGFLEQAAEKARNGRPFFLYIASNSPHDPRQAPKAFVDMYPPEKISVPANFLPEHPYKKAIGCPKGLRDEQLAPFPRTRRAVQVHRREYYAIITHLDAQIGKILDALDRTGLRGDTYVVFAADNGLAIGSHGLFGKQSVYEHSMKVPLIIAGPGIPAGKTIAAPVYMQDLTATVLELAGADASGWEYRSLMPLIRGDASAARPAVFGEYKIEKGPNAGWQRMVRQGDYKLIDFPSVKKSFLYNLADDPDERNDLSAALPGKARALARLLEK